MKGSCLGPEFSDEYIERYLNANAIKYKRYKQEQLVEQVADLIAQEKVIGWFEGRMEFGPRALGARSIIADARSKKMQSVMNLKIKYRESFRPFAPVVLEEDVGDYFEIACPSPYMLLVAPVKKQRRLPSPHKSGTASLKEIINTPRSDIPAVTHIDYSARVQTVNKERNGLLYELLAAFKNKTGCSVLVNTSFNVRGEPIVCTPHDAYRCFMRTEMDWLVMGSFVLDKREQKPLEENTNWQTEFELD